MTRRFRFCVKQLAKRHPDLANSDFLVYSVSSIDDPQDNTVLFTRKWSHRIEGTLANTKESVIIVPKGTVIEELQIASRNAVIYSDNPRLEYAIVLNGILGTMRTNKKYYERDRYVLVGENVSIGSGTVIEPFVTIDDNVVIGDRCVIKSGVRIGSDVTIADDAVIRDNSVIGGQGFGIERDGDKTIRIPHLGGVQIGSHVEIGALNTVASGTITPTTIEDYVKINDHVHIAHNCHIKHGVIITGCVNISGSTVVEECCYIGPNATIRNKVRIGKNSTIGMGAVVVRDVGEGEVVVGNPARPLREVD